MTTDLEENECDDEITRSYCDKSRDSQYQKINGLSKLAYFFLYGRKLRGDENNFPDEIELILFSYFLSISEIKTSAWGYISINVSKTLSAPPK